MDSSRPLFIPVILGTVRMGRVSEHAARLVTGELTKHTELQTELIDIAKIPLVTTDAGEAIKHPDFASRMERADALVIVSPEYNHGYSGLLKHVLDSCLKEYIHKAVGIVGVSAGPFGGTRVIQNLLPVMRELGLVTIFWDVNFSTVQDVFSADGRLRDPSYVRRIDKFLKELIWMAKTLRNGREQISLTEAMSTTASRMKCPNCGADMNHQADKIVYAVASLAEHTAASASDGALQELHTCPECGSVASRFVSV